MDSCSPPRSKRQKKDDASTRSTCLSFGKHRHSLYSKFVMCNGCDNWEIIVESGAIGKSQRSSRRNRCQARHTSFAFPTDLKKLSKKYAPLENIVESEEEESSEEEDEDERTEATAVPRRTNRLETNRPERNNNVNDNAHKFPIFQIGISKNKSRSTTRIGWHPCFNERLNNLSNVPTPARCHRLSSVSNRTFRH
jgi:hypothetical protein